MDANRPNRLMDLLSHYETQLPQAPGRQTVMGAQNPMDAWAGLQQLFGGGAMKNPLSLPIMQLQTQLGQSRGGMENMDMIMSLLAALLQNRGPQR